MKKSLLFFILIFTSITSQAQNKERTFKPFKLDLATGIGFPLDSKLHTSGLFSFEPKYSFSNHITSGFRLEIINLGPSSSIVGYIGDLTFTSSMLITTDYFFNTNRVRPFVGVGIGIFDVPAEDDPTFAEYKTKAGFLTRGGFELGRFRSAVELNLTGKTEVANFSYLSIKAGFYLWGARVKAN
jgi:outer membrane protein X